MRKSAKKITTIAIIAGLYVVLTLVSFAFGLANNAIQLRISEGLNILCLFSPVAYVGLTLGCLISNIIMGSHILDIIFGTIATFLGAVWIFKFKNFGFKTMLLAVVSNTVIIPIVIYFSYGVKMALGLFALSIFAGEVLSVFGIGWIISQIIKKHKIDRYL